MPQGSRRARRFSQAHPQTSEREALERRWFHRRVDRPDLAPGVTAQGTSGEPFHRWLRFRQGFSPSLVREFLKASGLEELRDSSRPVLDPFSGSGTTVIECAARGVPALGIEALPALNFLTAIRFSQTIPALPHLADSRNWKEIAPLLTEPLHQGALMIAEGLRHSLDGKTKAGPNALRHTFRETLDMMTEDLQHPLPIENRVISGDALNMRIIGDETISGILTSPPYLSRYDYARQVQPMTHVHDLWYSKTRIRNQDADHQRSAPRRKNQPKHRQVDPPAVLEACAALDADGLSDRSSMVRTYFTDLFQILQEFQRVLCDGGVCWIVIGGARVKGVYVPSDLILVEFAEQLGFRVDGVLSVRRLIESGRKLGGLQRVSPRESILVMTAVK